MGTQILQSHDSLVQQFESVPSFSSSSSSSCRGQAYANPRPDHKRRCGYPRRSPNPAAKLGREFARRNNGKKAASFDDRDLTVSRSRRAEARPAAEAGVYAGSAFSQSPSPSSLPLPTFSRRRAAAVDDLATKDLRRLLRIG